MNPTDLFINALWRVLYEGELVSVFIRKSCKNIFEKSFNCIRFVLKIILEVNGIRFQLKLISTVNPWRSLGGFDGSSLWVFDTVLHLTNITVAMNHN